MEISWTFYIHLPFKIFFPETNWPIGSIQSIPDYLRTRKNLKRRDCLFPTAITISFDLYLRIERSFLHSHTFSTTILSVISRSENIELATPTNCICIPAQPEAMYVSGQSVAGKMVAHFAFRYYKNNICSQNHKTARYDRRLWFFSSCGLKTKLYNL